MKVNPDLQKERDTATFDVEEVATVLYDGPENLEKKRKIESFMFSNDAYKSKPLEFMSRDEVYTEGLRRTTLAVSKKDELGDMVQNPEDLAFYNSMVMSVNVLFDLNYGMFVPTIIGQGTAEQVVKYAVPALNFEIIGTYAQTEMGHGTFLRGLETTCHYDVNTQEFVLNTPTVTSTKWWPGALGKTSTHCVVMAKLYCQGQYRGIHPFVLQLRSLEDHKPLPGITVGDIGPKFGYAANDNGFLRLSNVRIPRENMLMKYAQVAPDGTYTKPPAAKVAYGTMTLVRSRIVKMSAIWLSQAVTITTRYSAVRRQSEMRPNEPEPQVLSYPTQQHKVLPYIATAYAFQFVTMVMLQTYADVTARVADGDFSRSQELHAVSSGLKAFTSWEANFAAEKLRHACGGHGYSCASGFPTMYANCTPAVTYEGENTVLMLQVARYLVKCVKQARSGEPLTGSVAYLQSHHRGEGASVAHRRLQSQPTSNRNEDLTDPDFLIDVYRQRAYKQAYYVADLVDDALKRGLDLVGALNEVSIHGVRAASAHSHLFVIEAFVHKLRSLSTEVSKETLDVLSQLFVLYALFGVDQNSGDFLEDGILTSSQVKKMRQLSVDLLPILRPNAVALVDAFDFRDEHLNSVLGRYDGVVYPNLLKWAQSSPLNEHDVHPSYHKYLGPLLKRNLPSKL